MKASGTERLGGTRGPIAQHRPLAGSPGEALVAWTRQPPRSRFGRFWSVMTQSASAQRRVPSTTHQRQMSGAGQSPFPMPLPFPDVLGLGGGPRFPRIASASRSTQARSRRTCLGKVWVNLLVSHFSYQVLGRPRIPAGSVPAWATRPLTVVQEELAGRLLRNVARLLASNGGSIGPADGGRHRLLTALAQARMDHYLEPGAEPLSTIAERVELGCIAVPEVAGVVDPLDLPRLAKERRAVLANAHSTVLPMSEWPYPLPRACHLIDPEDEIELARRCLKNGMACLIREQDVPLDGEGRPLVGGGGLRSSIDPRRGRSAND